MMAASGAPRHQAGAQQIPPSPSALSTSNCEPHILCWVCTSDQPLPLLSGCSEAGGVGLRWGPSIAPGTLQSLPRPPCQDSTFNSDTQQLADKSWLAPACCLTHLIACLPTAKGVCCSKSVQRVQHILVFRVVCKLCTKKSRD